MRPSASSPTCSLILWRGHVEVDLAPPWSLRHCSIASRTCFRGAQCDLSNESLIPISSGSVLRKHSASYGTTSRTVSPGSSTAGTWLQAGSRWSWTIAMCFAFRRIRSRRDPARTSSRLHVTRPGPRFTAETQTEALTASPPTNVSATNTFTRRRGFATTSRYTFQPSAKRAIAAETALMRIASISAEVICGPLLHGEKERAPLQPEAALLARDGTPNLSFSGGRRAIVAPHRMVLSTSGLVALPQESFEFVASCARDGSAAEGGRSTENPALPRRRVVDEPADSRSRRCVHELDRVDLQVLAAVQHRGLGDRAL